VPAGLSNGGAQSFERRSHFDGDCVLTHAGFEIFFFKLDDTATDAVCVSRVRCDVILQGLHGSAWATTCSKILVHDHSDSPRGGDHERGRRDRETHTPHPPAETPDANLELGRPRSIDRTQRP
jgi:hypothetical protein